MKLRVLVADDERIARQRMVRLLSEIEDVVVSAECASADELLEALKREEIDLALLDIEMPGTTGMEALAMLGPRAPFVVFCTAHANYAVEAYDRGAVDYVLKPVDPERLRKAVERARARVRDHRTSHAGAKRRSEVRTGDQAPSDRLAIATKAGVVLVDPREITHATLDGALVTVFTASGAKFLTDDSLNELERKLPHMVRVHRRALVALEHVTRLEPQPTGGYVARTAGGHTIQVSRQAARDLRKRLGLRE